MRIMHLQIYLFILYQIVETLDHRTALGQNVTINCDLDEGEIYWLLLKASDPPVMILRTLPTTFFLFNKTFNHKYSVQSKNHLFINNITSDELGVYYCMKKATPPKFSNGTRLHVNETSSHSKIEVHYIQQNHTVVKYIEQKQTQWKIITITLGLLSGVLFIVIIGLIKVFVVGNKRSKNRSQQFQNTDLQRSQVSELQDPNQLQYAEVDFSKLRKKSRPRKPDTTYAALHLPKL